VTNTDEQAFMSAIVAEPDDDTRRLVFADWLDERGSEEDRARAALIRAQCGLENLPEGSKERGKLESEAQKILKKYEGRWTKPLRTARLLSNITFRRGFLDGGSMTPTTFVQRGEELFRLAPTLRSLIFPNAANEVTELAESPYLERLASVDLTYMCTCGICDIDVELRDLFKSKYATNLRCLSVARDRVNLEVMRALARSTVLGNLTSLDLSGNPMTTECVAALAASRKLTKLTRLDLARNGLQRVGVEALATAKHFPALTWLGLSANRIPAAGVKALVAAPFFKQLTAFDLSQNRITEAGAKALADAAGTSKLEHVDLRGARLGGRATKLLKAAFGEKVLL
jgi:uncharacterized protein (TIGR02996 family)